MTSQFHRKISVKMFDKLSDLKVVTVFYEGHFRHCVMSGRLVLCVPLGIFISRCLDFDASVIQAIKLVHL